MAKPGAAERPILRVFTQASFHGIIFNVSHRFREVFGISNVAVEIVRHPEPTLAPEEVVGFVRCKRFEGLHELGQIDGLESRQQIVNMIRHHNPRRQSITLTVVTEEFVLDHLGYALNLHEGFAITLIEIPFYSRL
jgi:hypothetical protein